MNTFPSIRLFAILFAISVSLSAWLAYEMAGTMAFAFPLRPEDAATLASRIQAIRALGLLFALVLMMLVVLAGQRAARGALALRWFLGLATNIAFLRAAGMVAPLDQHDAAIITLSAMQLSVEAFAILLLYGEDAAGWFATSR